MSSLQIPPANAPSKVIQYFLERQCLQQDTFAFRSVRVLLLKFKNREDELRYFMEALTRKESGTVCSFVDILDPFKRIKVTVEGHRLSVNAPQLVYQVFRNRAATRKSLVQSCKKLSAVTICINPYHYQMVDIDGENVPDELSSSDRLALGMVQHFPIVDVNELPDNEVIDEEEFLNGASAILSSTVAVPNVQKCQSCAEKDEQIKMKDDELKAAKKEIADLKKQLKDRNPPVEPKNRQ